MCGRQSVEFGCRIVHEHHDTSALPFHGTIFGIDEVLGRDFIQVFEQCLSCLPEFAYGSDMEEFAHDAAIVFGRCWCRGIGPHELKFGLNGINSFENEPCDGIARLSWGLVKCEQCSVKAVQRRDSRRIGIMIEMLFKACADGLQKSRTEIEGVDDRFCDVDRPVSLWDAFKQ